MHHQPPCDEKVLVGKTTMCVKKVGNKIGGNNYQQGQGFMRGVSRASCEEMVGYGKRKTVSVQKSLSVSLSSR